MTVSAWSRLPPGWRWTALLVAAVAVLLVACSRDDHPVAPEAITVATERPMDSSITGPANVFAAASLTDAFREIGDAFEQAHPGVAVEFNFAASSALATQIEQGAPADVFASANVAQMQRLVDSDLIDGEPQLFVRNLPVIVVPADNPRAVATAADLAKPGLRLVLALEDVPVGKYARQVIANLAANPAYGADFEAAALGNIVSSEDDVRAVLAKVELGEADAGVVYKTDAAVSGDNVQVIDFPEDANVVADYPIAIPTAVEHPRVAAAFIEFVVGETGQSILAAVGFDPAP